MLYAQVVFGLPIAGPFDYIVPKALYKKIKIGSRVWVPLRTQPKVGYVVRLAKKTNIRNLKVIQDVIDSSPILDKNMLLLTKQLSDYYCCSWGEAIEAAIPESLRRGKAIADISNLGYTDKKDKQEVILLHSLDIQAKWDMYIEQIKATLDNNRSAVLLFSDINSALKAKEIIKTRLSSSSEILYRKQPRELDQWLKIKRGEANIIIGSRSAIFAPVNNLGLLVIDEEQDSVYKQDQVPHYNARVVAFMRAKIERTKLILSSASPSLESFYLSQKAKIRYLLFPRRKAVPEIKIIDMSDFHLKAIFSKYLEDVILANLNSGGKALLFINRKGFATFASCRQCGFILKCSRCNINLVYHFKENILNCHYCNFKLEPPKICPNCNSSYIRYSGVGTEKIESELSRLFPQARVRRLEGSEHTDIGDADIFICTQSITKWTDYNFNLIAVLYIDNSLNRIDFRSAEKTFGLLVGLLGLTDTRLVIQTRLPNHYCFRALADNDTGMFYAEELSQRRQLKFPPFRHLAIVKLRGKNEDRAKKISLDLFNKLKKLNKNITIICAKPAQPSRLRGNYYWNILIRAKSPRLVTKFLKKHLKDFSHSGIIVTVDVDPL
ncbi:MAG: primosomal protein N' [Candidatus Omnitrophica bacterium]|nr:primosomal protein N' [Candidatus Omnitrophota bacterium]